MEYFLLFLACFVGSIVGMLLSYIIVCVWERFR